MALFKNHFVSVLIFFFTALIISCTLTTTKPKNPVFNEDMSIIQKDLNSIIPCKNINLDGKEVNTDGKINSELEIRITNGKDIPSDEEQRKALGKSIATYIKKALKDQTEYSKYSVLFVTEETSGVTTKRNWQGNVFTSEEL